MMMIDIPFLPDWKQSMLNGIKTHTCRSKAYGKSGDRFKKWGAVFELISVQRMQLKQVAEEFHQQEGCHTPYEFVRVWNKIHPRRLFIGTDVKFLHEFKLVQPTKEAS